MQTNTVFEAQYNPFMHIDTLAISKKLRAAGTPKKQAEAQAKIWGELVTYNLASKIDIINLEEKIENSRKDTVTITESVRKDLVIEIEKVRGEIIKSKNSLLMWLVPIMIGQVAATIGFAKLLLDN